MGTGEADDVVSGRSHDRQWAVLMSATGQLRGRLRAVSRGRRHSVEADFCRGCAYRFEAVFLDQGQGVHFLCPVGALN